MGLKNFCKEPGRWDQPDFSVRGKLSPPETSNWKQKETTGVYIGRYTLALQRWCFLGLGPRNLGMWKQVNTNEKEDWGWECIHWTTQENYIWIKLGFFVDYCQARISFWVSPKSIEVLQVFTTRMPLIETWKEVRSELGQLGKATNRLDPHFGCFFCFQLSAKLVPENPERWLFWVVYI